MPPLTLLLHHCRLRYHRARATDARDNDACSTDAHSTTASSIQPLLLALYNTLHKLLLAILSRALPFALPLRALVYRHSVVNRPVQ